jgi:hypothetical protein
MAGWSTCLPKRNVPGRVTMAGLLRLGKATVTRPASNGKLSNTLQVDKTVRQMIGYRQNLPLPQTGLPPRY